MIPATFEFATAGRIVFGCGKLSEAGPIARALGDRALVVTGRDPARAERLVSILEKAGVVPAVFCTPGEPDLATVSSGVAHARAAGSTVVLALGGGSAIDAGKAIAAMLTNPGELLDYLEVVGRGQALPHPSAPFVAIPTTAGTGSEVTRNAVLASPAHRVKVSLRSPYMLPRVALVDPELTLGLPRSVAAATGLDALTQLIEPYVCTRANPMTDAVCVEGLRRAASALPALSAGRTDPAVRENMGVASLFGGLALANAGLGAAHGFAGPLGGMFPAPHGAICAALLPRVMAANIHALRSRDPGGPALERYRHIAQILTGNPQAGPEDGAAWVEGLACAFDIPRLGTYGVLPAHVSELVEKARNASSMKPNPVCLQDEELAGILRAAL